LNHPHILTIFEIGQTDSRHFIVTEFIEGEMLRQRIKGCERATKARANAPAAWDDLRAVWKLDLTLEGHPQ
jgi:serine/threonine protein kinase